MSKTEIKNMLKQSLNIFSFTYVLFLATGCSNTPAEKTESENEYKNDSVDVVVVDTTPLPELQKPQVAFYFHLIQQKL